MVLSFDSFHRLRALGVALPLLFAACGERNPAWDQPFVRGDSVGLMGSVAVVD
ncbi:MAG: hypothetical protein QM756_28405 [Polyangiaceae bacterium]